MKDVVGYEGRYRVDAVGNVYSVVSGKFLSGFLNHKGYRKVELWNEAGEKKHKFVHRILWETYNGNVPVGFQIDHIDRDKLNNNLSNLRVVTPKENVRNSSVFKTGKYSL